MEVVDLDCRIIAIATMPMSRSEWSDMDRVNMEEIAKVQQKMIGVAMGDTPMEYPGAPQTVPGQRYQPNASEKEFISRSRTILYKNLIQYSFLLGAGPFLVSRLRFRVNPNLKPSTFNRPRFWGILGCMC